MARGRFFEQGFEGILTIRKGWARAMPFTSRAVQRPRTSWPVFPLPAGWTAVEIQDNKQVTLLRPTPSSRDSIGFKAKTRAGARGRESARAAPVHRACYENYLPRTMGLSMGLEAGAASVPRCGLVWVTYRQSLSLPMNPFTSSCTSVSPRAGAASADPFPPSSRRDPGDRQRSGRRVAVLAPASVTSLPRRPALPGRHV
jgi:hypothetical protein